MQAVVMDYVERTAPKSAHQGEIGVMLLEEGDIARLGGADLRDFRLIADGFKTQLRVGMRRRKQRDRMTLLAKLLTEEMGVHFKAARKRLGDRIFEMGDNADAHQCRP